jgi:PAS domain S-box-containing protein
MCGNVICGRFDPSKPFFTQRGSFWTNSTTQLLASTSEADRQARTRNRCNGEGYESVALMPLRVGEERLGLLQLNDRRKGRFSPEIIALWERLADHLAVALAKFRADEKLRESEQRYRSLFENMLDGYAYCKMLFDDQERPVDFVYLAVNSAFERLTGLKDVEGKCVTKLIPGIKETHPEVFETYGRVARTGKQEKFELDFTLIGLWLSITVYGAGSGHFVVVFENITEQKRAKDELAAAARQWSISFDAMADGVSLHDADHTILNANQSLCQLLGKTKEEIVGKKCYQVFHGIGSPILGCPLERTRKTFGKENTELFESTLNRWLAASTSPVFDDAGRLVRLVHVMRDITERKQAEAALKESEARLRSVIETSPDAIAMLGLDGRILMANQPAVRLFGFDNIDELLSSVTNGFDLLAPEDYQRANDDIRNLVTRGVLRDLEYCGIRRDGSRFPTELSASLQRDSDGNPAAMILVMRDITQRKQSQQLLEQAKETAEAANRAKSAFLANMSHELRTPMTAILGFSDLLMTPNLPHSEQIEFSVGIQRNGKALLKLINDILDLSRIEAVRLTLEKEDYPLKQLIGDVVSMVKVRAEEKRLKLEVDYGSLLPEKIHTDPARLRQILVNLASNAVKFTERGEVRIALRRLGKGGETTQLQFAVSDTGIGIAADKTRELFQPFVQADASVSRRYGGAGLGLAISDRLAKALGGRIEVASELGKGSTFTLTIDVGEPKDAGKLQSPRAARAAREAPLPGKRLPPLHGRLLLVEDEPDIQRVIRLLLRKTKLEVDVAATGQMACDLAQRSKAEERPYDLILMDIQMPEMDGYEAVRQLRRNGWQGSIVALTAHAMIGDREKCLAAGCDDYVAKPQIMTGLQAVLKRYLSNPSQSPS